jgi:hypothetical protein
VCLEPERELGPSIAGCATSIGVGPLSAGTFFGDAFGDAWITGWASEGNGYGIYQLQFGSWVKIPGSAVEIAVSQDLGVPWIVNSLQQIYQ